MSDPLVLQSSPNVKEKRRRGSMPSRFTGVAAGVHSEFVAAAAAQVQGVKTELRKVRKYAGKKIHMDAFFCIKRKLECEFGYVIGLDRCSGVVLGGSVNIRSWFVYVNGVGYRRETLPSCVDFLAGFDAGVGFARNQVRFSGEQPASVETSERVMGDKI